jgi:hypothetical protein
LSSFKKKNLQRNVHLAGPDGDWSQKLVPFLQHKGDPWNWQNGQALTHDLGIDVRFYVLTRGIDKAPLANVTLFEVCTFAERCISPSAYLNP